MIEVEVPGVGVVEFPDSMSQAEIQSALQGLTSSGVPAIPQPVKPPLVEGEVSTRDAIARSALEKLLTNVGQLPQTAVDALVGLSNEAVPAINQVESALGLPQSQPSAGVDLGLPTGTDTFAGVQSLVEGVPFNDARQEQQLVSDLMRSQAPVASAVGEGIADIGTLFLARQGAKRVLSPDALTKLSPAVEKQAQSIMGGFFKSAANAFGRTVKRSAETGIEGAFLASLQNVDPAQAGAIAFGGQFGGDALRGVVGGIVKRAGGIPQAVATVALTSLAIQQFTPGGLDRVLPALEKANKEVFLATILSGVSAAAFGRLPKGFAPKALGGDAFSELVDVTKRGAVLSTINSFLKDPDRTGVILSKFSEDPDFFGSEAKRRLSRAINSEQIDVSNTVENLMKIRSFRRQFESLSQ